MRIFDTHVHTGKWAFHSDMVQDDIPTLLERFHIEKAVFSSGTALMYDLAYGNEENFNFIRTRSGYYGYVVVNQNLLKDSMKELSRYLGREKIVGVKMHPELFKHPVNSAASKELLGIINSYGLPVLIHTSHFEVCRPSTVLEIAEEFPKNKYILAHMGNAWWREAIDTASKADNIYMDIISSWGTYDQIKIACDTAGEDRVLYGSDLNLLDPSISIGMVSSSEVSDEVKGKIFYKNASMLFRI